jgi:hypothetical protein
MRVLTAFAAIAPLALAAPDILGAFEPAVVELSSVDNSTAADIFKRQGDNCAKDYYACSNLNAPGLCCPRTAICSADRAQNVGCCPQGIACTGTLGQASATGSSALSSGTASGTAPFAPATTTSGSFVQTPDAPSSAAPSTVTNAFFPFPYIATTYTNAAACSRAYERCQDDTARCTAALANGGHGGVTVQAPGGQGATITAVPSLGTQSAASICQSLSSQACYGLKVEACQAFGGDSAARQRACAGAGAVYVVGAAGVAVGIAGGLL